MSTSSQSDKIDAGLRRNGQSLHLTHKIRIICFETNKNLPFFCTVPVQNRAINYFLSYQIHSRKPKDKLLNKKPIF